MIGALHYGSHGPFALEPIKISATPFSSTRKTSSCLTPNFPSRYTPGSSANAIPVINFSLKFPLLRIQIRTLVRFDSSSMSNAMCECFFIASIGNDIPGRDVYRCARGIRFQHIYSIGLCLKYNVPSCNLLPGK